jgi:hypothetical protein
VLLQTAAQQVDDLASQASLTTIGGYLDTEIAAIFADTNELQTDWANGGRLDLILDAVLAMLDDARAEPAQGNPPANPDAMTKLDYLYKAWRNKKTETRRSRDSMPMMARPWTRSARSLTTAPR